MKKSVEHKITFGKDRYHQHVEMEKWCRANLGAGGWLIGTPETWEGLDNTNWSMDSMFGRTTFCFRKPEDLTLFLLRWS